MAVRWAKTALGAIDIAESAMTANARPDFQGVLTSDCLASYEKLPYKMHKCYAHHLKAIAQAQEDQP